jgi:hypothetical protein
MVYLLDLGILLLELRSTWYMCARLMLVLQQQLDLQLIRCRKVAHGKLARVGRHVQAYYIVLLVHQRGVELEKSTRSGACPMHGTPPQRAGSQGAQQRRAVAYCLVIEDCREQCCQVGAMRQARFERKVVHRCTLAVADSMWVYIYSSGG